jgi:serine phosphatase RsbU (regulator of sigma subunit)
MQNPFEVFNKKKISFVVKNIVLLILSILLILLLKYFNILEIEQGFFWIIFNLCFILLILVINFPELKYIKNLLDLISFFHASESHSLFQVQENLQKLIYPKNFEDENYAIYSKLQPVTYLGGDIINFTKDSTANYWFAVGDASGHDLNSHLFSMMILNQMNLLVNMVETPLQVNGLINQNLKEKVLGISLSNYATLGILKADKEGNFIHYGLHPNYILFRASSKENEIIETSGHFIGIEISKSPYFKSDDVQENRKFKMNSGDILFCFTDGIYEQRNSEKKYFGYRLYDFIQKEDKTDLKKFLDNLFTKVVEFSSGQIDDDMTMMIIQKK